MFLNLITHGWGRIPVDLDDKRNYIMKLVYINILAIISSSCMSDQEFHCRTRLGAIEFDSIEACLLSYDYPNDYFCRTKSSLTKFGSREICMEAQADLVAWDCAQEEILKEYASKKQCIAYRRDPGLALEAQKKSKSQYLKELEMTAKTCSKTQKENCSSVLEFIDFNGLESMLDEAQIYKRKAYYGLCDSDNPDEQSCNSWHDWEPDSSQRHMPALHGCKVFNGQSCLNLFNLVRESGDNNKTKELFKIAAKVLKLECYSGNELSCKYMENLGDTCIRSDFECKLFRIQVNKDKLDRKRALEEQVNQIEKEEFQKRISAEKVRIQREMLANQERMEKERRWEKIGKAISNIFKNPYEEKKTRCTGKYNRFSKEYVTTCEPSY